MSVFIIAFMAMLGATAAVAVAPFLLWLLLISAKAAFVLGLALGVKWALLKAIRKDERQEPREPSPT
jgi:membrane protein implicated in regulation of membrane protease activity